MLRIDAHNHFWKYDPVRDNWIVDRMSVIARDFLPSDLEPLLKAEEIDGCIAVQADQSEEETHFLAGLAADNSFIKGVVGWVDLRSATLEETMEQYQSLPVVKGFRHILQGEKQRDLMLTSEFRRGIGLLGKYGFTYDILIYPDQLGYAWTLCNQFPDQLFIIDHLAKPAIKSGDIGTWKKEIERFADLENVYCKVSGMITEADWRQWTDADFRPALDTVTSTFGTGRLLFGSDWPVCLLAGSYSQVVALTTDYYSSFSSTEKAAIFGGNAQKFYRL